MFHGPCAGDVPQRLYEDFISAPPHGRFFAAPLRDKFAYAKKRAAALQ